jgi:hypothetical protein
MNPELFVSFYINVLLSYCLITACFYIYDLRSKLNYRDFKTHRGVQTDPSTSDHVVRVVIEPDNSIRLSEHAVG